MSGFPLKGSPSADDPNAVRENRNLESWRGTIKNLAYQNCAAIGMQYSVVTAKKRKKPSVCRCKLPQFPISPVVSRITFPSAKEGTPKILKSESADVRVATDCKKSTQLPCECTREGNHENKECGCRPAPRSPGKPRDPKRSKPLPWGPPEIDST